ncbi:MAG: DNA translocase FtsK, partial [Thermodesulfobacteria bacterium]|nr:DNA translocase FtsK [Thermodesulfobacteriota bacterium]
GLLFLVSTAWLAPLFGLDTEIAHYPFGGGLLGVLGRSLMRYIGRPGLALIVITMELFALCIISGLSPRDLFSKMASFFKSAGQWLWSAIRPGGHLEPALEPRVPLTEEGAEEDFPSQVEPPKIEAQPLKPEEQEAEAPRISDEPPYHGVPEEDEDEEEEKAEGLEIKPPVKKKGTYERPPLTLLDDPPATVHRESREELLERAKLLEEKLANFGVKGKVTGICPGPVITVYEYEPAPGVKINKITSLADDLALGLKAASVRIVAPIPGKSAVGIEVANREREVVYLKEILASEAFRKARSKLTLALGKDISGKPVVTDLARMPHLLIAGATGTGKSVCLHSMLISLLYKSLPDEVRFLLVDPKRIELSVYEGIPHLLHPVVLEPKMATQVLKWAVSEMERRYQLLEEARARNLESYNAEAEEKLPYIVIVVDELADLMVVSSKEVEMSLTRLAQMARAAGIHLLLATQRPSVDVLTGIIKANFPARISFQVSSRTDSRTILDTGGAERLLGAGDMLFLPPGTSKLQRIHGAYVSEKEVRRVVEFWKAQGEPEYETTILTPGTGEEGALEDEEVDELYEQAVELVIKTGQASISMLQRRLRVGYNRAARMIERMEREGIVGPSDGVRPRPVLVRPDH